MEPNPVGVPLSTPLAAEETNIRRAQRIMFYILAEIDKLCERHNIAWWLDAGTLLGAIRHKGFIPWDDDADVAMLREDFEKFIRVASQSLPEDLYLECFLLDRKVPRTICRIRHRHSRLKETGNLQAQGVFVDILPFDRYSASGAPPLMRYKLSKALYYCDAAVRWGGQGAGFTGKKAALMRAMTPLFRLMSRMDANWYPHLIRRLLPGAVRRAHKEPTIQIGYGFELPWRNYVYPLEEIFPVRYASFEGRRLPIPRDADAVLRRLYGDTYMTPLPPDQRGGHALELTISQMPVMDEENED